MLRAVHGEEPSAGTQFDDSLPPHDGLALGRGAEKRPQMQGRLPGAESRGAGGEDQTARLGGDYTAALVIVIILDAAGGGRGVLDVRQLLGGLEGRGFWLSDELAPAADEIIQDFLAGR